MPSSDRVCHYRGTHRPPSPQHEQSGLHQTHLSVMEGHHMKYGLQDLPLDILGQTEHINRLYTQITLCFPVRVITPSTRADIIGNLEKGLARLSKNFPWISGEVVRNDNVFSITSTDSASGLVVKELQDDATVPTWDELKQADFPFSMFDEGVVAPCKTIVDPDSKRPVLLAQANFVKGGLLLTFNAQHGSMDMAGQAQVVTLFAKTCRGEDFTKDEVEIGNMQRTNRIPVPDHTILGAPDSPNTEPQEVIQDVGANAKPREAQPSAPSHDLVWAYLDFPAPSLSSLKKLASHPLASDVTFVSTDDVLSAFIWRSITRARHPRLGSPESTKTTLTRNVDVRRHLDLPPTYPGLMTTATSHTYSVDDIINQRSLGAIASDLRRALTPDSLRNSAETQAGTIARSKGAAAQRSIAVLSNPSFDVRLSSWAKEKLYYLDFGPCLGQPEAVRRPMFTNGAREGLVYFLPKGRDGSIVVGICLREEDMERLRMDREVLQWSAWIG